MKNHKLFYLLLFVPLSMWSQTIEITPSYGYQFGSRVNYGPNYIQFDDSDQFGISLGYEIRRSLFAEASYLRHSSQINIRDIVVSPTKARLADLNADWFLVGIYKYFKQDNIQPFVGLGSGVVVLTPSNENRDIVRRRLDDETKLTFTFKAGVNFMITESIGINLQGNLLMPIEWGGVYVSGGPGGIGGGVNTGSTTVFAGFSGGLVFRLGAKSKAVQPQYVPQN